MILSKIKLQGFKSFAKKLELRFDGRITAIVGPNGCGKTNIVDAIRWGLGEQRPTVLRADRMENLIFGGAQSSRPLGMAEVSVFFDNSQHLLPIDYSEVVITRRLFRSGESEYLLNKSTVRLKDIQDLIMDTGIGADAYSVIELKMVEDILSDKAEDRRKLLEEAAGVTKYKHRLRAAERKLDATHGDLLRVNDIIREVERTVNSLKRQVQRAKRYKVYEERIQDLDLACGAQTLMGLREQISPLRKELGTYKKQREGQTTELSKEETEMETFRLQVLEREKELTHLREGLNETIEVIHRKESDIRVNKERISSLTDRIQRYSQEVGELERRLEEQTNHQEATKRDREALQVKITSTGRIFNNKQKELEVFQQGLNLKRLDLNKKKREIIDCLESINSLNSEETELRARIDNSRGRLERLDEEDGANSQTMETAQSNRKDLEKTLKTQQDARSKLVTKKGKLISDEKKLTAEVETAREAFYRDQSELELLKGRLAFLRNVLETHGGVSDGARNLMKMKVTGLIGVFADLLETKEPHRHAIEAGLGEAARYVVFDTSAHALAAVSTLKRSGGGRAALVATDRSKGLPQRIKRPAVPAGVDVVGWGDELISCDTRMKPFADFLLGDLLVVKDLDAANQVADAFPDGSVRAATLDGDLLSGWGMLQAGEVAEVEVSIVGRKQRIEETQKRITALEKQLADTTDRLKDAEGKKTALIADRENMESSVSDADSGIVETEKALAEAGFEIRKAEESMTANVKERQKLLEEIEKGKDRLEDLRPKMEALLEEREEIETSTARIQMEVDRLEDEERNKESEVHRINLTLVRLNGEAKNLEYEIERSKALIEEVKKTISDRNSEIEKAEKEIVRLEAETETSEKTLAEDYSKKEVREKEVELKLTSYETLKEELLKREREIRAVRKDRDEVADRVHALEMEVAELEHQAKSLKDRVKEAYGKDLEKIKPEEALDLAETEVKIEELRRKMKGLGLVNLMALEEYETEKKRLDFLSEQRTDLLSAEETLKETILKINNTARERFAEVFDKVRTNFRETFTRFFQGGEADLRLPENEDPLEAQVEIIARPAGKHFRDLDLLSGGERALTAISLLFALYLVKPSPFCILDEIDAPLDDANVERFTRVLGEFAEKTQFVIVTHNKMTMKVAQALYGVTMEQEGVSKIVSVRFGEKEEVIEAA